MMCLLTKHKHPLIGWDRNKKFVPITWYSHISYNRKPSRIDYSCMPLRRSSRLMKVSTTQSASGHDSLRRSDRTSLPQGKEGVNGGEEKRPAKMPLVEVTASLAQLSPEIMVRRCHSQSRGSVYSPIFGICCHFCRQKKLCGEEDCKRCGNPDINEPCIGKTDCLVCHSSNGVLCRACVKVRYGEAHYAPKEENNGSNWDSNLQSSGNGIRISGTSARR